jgi:hypothetical protein
MKDEENSINKDFGFVLLIFWLIFYCNESFYGKGKAAQMERV